MDIVSNKTPLRFEQVAGINFPVTTIVPRQSDEAWSFVKALRGYQCVHSYLPELDVCEDLLISVLPGALSVYKKDKEATTTVWRLWAAISIDTACTPFAYLESLLEFLSNGIERYLPVQAGIQKLRKMVNKDDSEVNSLLRYSVPSGQKRLISYVPTTTRPCSKVRGAPPISVPAHVLVQFLEGNGWCLKAVKTSLGEFLEMCMGVSSLDELEEELFSLSDCFE